MHGRGVSSSWAPSVHEHKAWFGLKDADCQQVPRSIAHVLFAVTMVVVCADFHSKVGIEHALHLVLFALAFLLSIVFFALSVLASDPQIQFKYRVRTLIHVGLVLPLIHATSAECSPCAVEKFFVEAGRFCSVGISSVVLQLIFFRRISLVASSLWCVGLAVHLVRYAVVHTRTPSRLVSTDADVSFAAGFTASVVLLAPSILLFDKIQRPRVPPEDIGDALESVEVANQEDMESGNTHSVDMAGEDLELRSLNSVEILFACEEELPELSERQREHRVAFLKWPEAGDALATVRALPFGRKSHTMSHWYKRYLLWRTKAMTQRLPTPKRLMSERAARLGRLWADMDQQDRDRDHMSFTIFTFYHHRGRVAKGRLPNTLVVSLMSYIVEAEVMLGEPAWSASTS